MGTAITQTAIITSGYSFIDIFKSGRQTNKLRYKVISTELKKFTEYR